MELGEQAGGEVLIEPDGVRDVQQIDSPHWVALEEHRTLRRHRYVPANAPRRSRQSVMGPQREVDHGAVGGQPCSDDWRAGVWMHGRWLLGRMACNPRAEHPGVRVDSTGNAAGMEIVDVCTAPGQLECAGQQQRWGTWGGRPKTTGRRCPTMS